MYRFELKSLIIRFALDKSTSWQLASFKSRWGWLVSDIERNHTSCLAGDRGGVGKTLTSIATIESMTNNNNYINMHGALLAVYFRGSSLLFFANCKYSKN